MELNNEILVGNGKVIGDNNIDDNDVSTHAHVVDGYLDQGCARFQRLPWEEGAPDATIAMYVDVLLLDSGMEFNAQESELKQPGRFHF